LSDLDGGRPVAALAAEGDDLRPVLHDHTVDRTTAAAGDVNDPPVDGGRPHELLVPPDGGILGGIGAELSCLHRNVPCVARWSAASTAADIDDCHPDRGRFGDVARRVAGRRDAQLQAACALVREVISDRPNCSRATSSR
jgi:hypothetical protein